VTDARRVLIAWIVGTQILALPLLAFAAGMALLGTGRRTDSSIPMLTILVLGILLVLAGIAFACGVALRGRLGNRLSFSPLVVALASGIGLFGALIFALAMARIWLASGRLAPVVFYLLTTCGLGLGSGLGALVGCRYRPGPGAITISQE
jgi:hypothetical protein